MYLLIKMFLSSYKSKALGAHDLIGCFPTVVVRL